MEPKLNILEQVSKLMEYVKEFDLEKDGSLWTPRWAEERGIEHNYFVYYNHSVGEWEMASNWEAQGIQVYMSWGCAYRLTKKLNKGTFSL